MEVLQTQVVNSLQQIQVHASEGSFLTLFVESEKLIPALLDQINSDIKEKVEQDVELLDLTVSGPNSLTVKGRAGAMGIKKEFDVHTAILLDKEAQIILLKVKDIEVKGGFLVRKGFELVEPKIKNMIEKSVRISLPDLLEKAIFSTKIPNTEKIAQIVVQHGIVHKLMLDQEDALIRIQLDFSLQIHVAV